MSLNKVCECGIFPAKTVHQGFFSAVNNFLVTAQLFHRYSNSAKLPRVNRSGTLTIGIQTGTMSVSSNLTNSVLMNWDADYPNNKFEPPQGYKLEMVNTEQNHVDSREQLQDCGYLSNLITKFEEDYIWLEVQSVWLIWKLKDGSSFQDLNQNLACNGQTVYTIVVNLGSLELQAIAGEIDKDNIVNIAYAPDIEPTSLLDNSSDREMMKKASTNGDNEGEAKQVSVVQSLTYSDDKDCIDNMMLILTKRFAHPFQETVTLGISFWVDLKILTQWE